MVITDINSLPVVIDAAGDYVCRDGSLVTIHEVKHTALIGCTEFAAVGSRHQMFRGKVRPRGYDIWHVSGRRRILTERSHDIVSKRSV